MIRTYCNGSFVIATLCAHLVTIDHFSLPKVIGVPISLRVNIFLISVTEL